MDRKRSRWTAAAVALCGVLGAGAGVTAHGYDAVAADGDARARRVDHGALTVIDVYGSYEAMGRQQVALLRAEAVVLRDLYDDRWRGLVRSQGLLGRFVDGLVVPTWTTFGGWREDSGMFDETAGIARALGGGGGDGLRWVYGGVFGGGSTVFAATGAATADGRAIIGRNVDWADDTGRRRPLVTRYHPDDGGLVHLAVSWPLITVPIVGLNEAGLAISINFFDSDQMFGLGFPRYLYRRVLQRARTVDEAVALLTERGNRGGPGFVLLADAAGAVALAECSATRCAVHQPADGWLGHANHSRTPEMHDHDEGRTADTDRRRRAMEDAVTRHLGHITPAVAAEILRDRSNSPFMNDSTVGNVHVLNPVVIDPVRRLLWHSTTQQPLAPFGEMVPVTVDGGPTDALAIPADPRLATPGMQREIETVATLRQAARLFAVGRVGDAGALWDRVTADPARMVEPHRSAWARARVRWSTGKLRDADALLVTADAEAAPFEVRAYAKVVRGMIADREGRRADALASYGDADAWLDAHPEYDAPTLVGPLHRWIDEGRAAPAAGRRFPAMPDLQCIPQ